jgi:hypothetical protein
MIRAKLNLICPRGHRHYSPTPKAFVGRGCSASKPNDTKKCELTLRLLKTNG